MKLLHQGLALFLSWSLVLVGVRDGFAYQTDASVAQPPPQAAQQSPEQLQQLVAPIALVWVAVGISVARYPPHRSPRAALPHEALILDEWRQSELEGMDGEHAVVESIDPPAFASAPR